MSRLDSPPCCCCGWWPRGTPTELSGANPPSRRSVRRTSSSKGPRRATGLSRVNPRAANALRTAAPAVSGRPCATGTGDECPDRSAARLRRQPAQIVVGGEIVLHCRRIEIDRGQSLRRAAIPLQPVNQRQGLPDLSRHAAPPHQRSEPRERPSV